MLIAIDPGQKGFGIAALEGSTITVQQGKVSGKDGIVARRKINGYLPYSGPMCSPRTCKTLVVERPAFRFKATADQLISLGMTAQVFVSCIGHDELVFVKPGVWNERGKGLKKAEDLCRRFNVMVQADALSALGILLWHAGPAGILVKHLTALPDIVL